MSDDRKGQWFGSMESVKHTPGKINNMVQLLKRIFPWYSGLVLGAGLTANAQTSNFRSLYLKDVDVWCGNTTTENTIPQLLFGEWFQLHHLLRSGVVRLQQHHQKNQLAAFMSRARQNYGITQFGASGRFILSSGLHHSL